ncbi:MAG TPA: tetratricopeptide repeat protein [Pyrinomonadaceae bacterium]
MGFDKAKVLRAAEKYLAQGKIPAAIAEYRQIVENDADDVMALNVLGDLYARADKKREAISCFTRIADHYREQGFALKAIAMYKKVERLQPGAPEVASQLAALYEAQGLVVDARAQYMTVAEAYSRAGQIHKALEVLRRIADLDPENIEIRRRLAEGYARENFQTESAESYNKVGDLLLARGQYEQALGPYSLVLNVFPFDHKALAGLLAAHIALGTAQEAAELLERAVAEMPEDAELLSMLARAHVESGDVAAAERSTAALIQRDKDNYPRFVDVARLYLKEGDVDSCIRVLGSIVQQMLTGREEEQVISILREALLREPEHINALRLLVHVHRWQRDEESLRIALERLAEAARKAGLVDEERNAVAQLARLVPDNQYYYDRLAELGDAPAEALYSNESIFDTAGAEAPAFEGFSQGQTSETTAEAPPTGEFAEFEWNSVANETPAETGAAPATRTDPAASFADLNADWANLNIPDEPAQVSQAPPTAASNFQEIDFESVAMGTPAEAPAPAASQPPSATDADPRRETLLLQELESVDFYLAQGYGDIAQETLTMLERQFGAHPAIDARRARLEESAEAASGQQASASTPPASSNTEEDVTVDFSGFSLYDIHAEEAAAAEEARAQKVGPAPQPAARPKAQTAVHPELADVFDEFRAAVEEDEPASSDDDYETHYNLGLAYSEMELVDEAVEEFQIAAGLVAPRDGTPRYLQCCNLLGHCFMKKGLPRVAAIWFKKGLDAPGHTEDEYQALRYELGTAYEQMGELDRAIETFTEVYGINVTYRGVAGKLNELKRMKDQGSDVRG